MAFRFSLASVLKLRESLEQRDLLLLEQTQHEIFRTRQQMEELQQEQDAARRLEQRELAEGTPAASLHFGEQVRKHLQDHALTLGTKLVELQLRRKQQLEAYQDSKGKRQVLRDLRDRQRAVHEAKLEHQAQRTADDNFLARDRQG